MSDFRPPRLALSCRSLQGALRVPRDRMLEITARHHEPESLAVALSKAHDAGAEAILTAPSRPMRAALAELERSLPLLAVLPEIPERDRDDIGPGAAGLLERRRHRMAFGSRARMLWTRLARVPAWSGRDMASNVALLLEAEAGALPARGVRAVLLAAPLTDLALATGHRAFFERYVRFVRRRFGVAAGLETWNLGTLLARLREWQSPVDLVAGPVNPAGVRMKPTPEDTLAELRRSAVPVIATDLRAGGPCSLVDAARHARAHGVHGLAPDLAELDDVARELRVLRSDAPEAPAETPKPELARV